MRPSYAWDPRAAYDGGRARIETSSNDRGRAAERRPSSKCHSSSIGPPHGGDSAARLPEDMTMMRHSAPPASLLARKTDLMGRLGTQVRYIASSLSSTGVDYLMLLILNATIGGLFAPVIIARTASCTMNYLINRRVFRARGGLIATAARYYAWGGGDHAARLRLTHDPHEHGNAPVGRIDRGELVPLRTQLPRPILPGLRHRRGAALRCLPPRLARRRPTRLRARASQPRHEAGGGEDGAPPSL